MCPYSCEERPEVDTEWISLLFWDLFLRQGLSYWTWVTISASWQHLRKSYLPYKHIAGSCFGVTGVHQHTHLRLFLSFFIYLFLPSFLGNWESNSSLHACTLPTETPPQPLNRFCAVHWLVHWLFERALLCSPRWPQNQDALASWTLGWHMCPALPVFSWPW